jgi:hypothetical protein
VAIAGLWFVGVRCGRCIAHGGAEGQGEIVKINFQHSKVNQLTVTLKRESPGEYYGAYYQRVNRKYL